mmetsp:Transcript_32261/g.32877  ORF Transcript_32261/g.32877 Transcript_32261/m.32877 type:complete len:365 (-) Transcript_32261:145-1239(-)
MMHRYLLTLTILVVSLNLSASDEFELIIETSNAESECIDFVKSEVQSFVYHRTHIPIVMRKGYWQCAKEIISIAQRSGSDVRNIFDLESRQVMKEIAALKAVVDSSLPIASITPAFQWAQSPNEVFINVKFAHKIDAPATLNVESKNVTVIDGSLYLSATDGRKNFVLDIELLRDIRPDESTWSMASVGRMVFTLRKDDAPSKWTRLLKSKDKKPSNMHSWWELADKYREELDKLDEDEADDEWDEPKKKSAKKKPVEADSNLTETNTVTEMLYTEEKRETEEEREKKEKKLKIQEDLQSKLRELDEDIRARKREIEKRMREEKRALDAEKKAKKTELEDEAARVQAEIDGVLPTEVTQVNNEL